MERERRRQQLIGLSAVVVASGVLGTATAARAQQTVLIRLERRVLGESGLLRVRAGERGIDGEAAEQLRGRRTLTGGGE